MTPPEQSYFEGRFLDGKLTLLLSELADPGPGYAVNPLTGRIWRNGEHVGDVLSLRYDRNALGWWVEYQSWRGSPLDHPPVPNGSADSRDAVADAGNALDRWRAEKVLLLLYTQYAYRLPTHVLLQIKLALWPDGDGPTVPEAAHSRRRRLMDALEQRRASAPERIDNASFPAG